jgi:hypothetical protein
VNLAERLDIAREGEEMIMRYIYQAVAQYDGKDAGAIKGADARTKDQCRALARKLTRMTVAVRRVRVSQEQYDQAASS